MWTFYEARPGAGRGQELQFQIDESPPEGIWGGLSRERGLDAPESMLAKAQHLNRVGGLSGGGLGSYMRVRHVEERIKDSYECP